MPHPSHLFLLGTHPSLWELFIDLNIRPVPILSAEANLAAAMQRFLLLDGEALASTQGNRTLAQPILAPY